MDIKETFINSVVLKSIQLYKTAKEVYQKCIK